MRVNWVPWGIDLGTTNSVIAVFAAKSPEVLPNPQGNNTTPSAVSISNGALPLVGERAMQRVGFRSTTVHRQFKPFIGDGKPFLFEGVAAPYTAMDLSAMVLGELSKMRRSKGEFGDIDAAVITVPQAFSGEQREATLAAGQRAGFGQVHLLTEPTAAALAYGIDVDTAHEPVWLVYDLGGGTFDAALLRCRDGHFDFIDHRGDPQLGGSHLNQAIVDELLVPQLAPHERELMQSDRELHTLLEREAEVAKCAISFESQYTIELSYQAIETSLVVTAEQVRSLETRLFARTVDLCRELLVRNSFAPDDIDKIIMVGGQTRSAHIQEMLYSGAEDPVSKREVEGLGIELDTSGDPMTIVGRGAALFGAHIQLTNERAAPRSADQAFEIRIASSIPVSVTSDRQMVVGRCIDAPETVSLVAQRLAGAAVGWESQVHVEDNGTFQISVPLEIGPNPIVLTAWDELNRELSRAELTVTYTTINPDASKLDEGLGVANADGGVDWFFERHDLLPRERELPFRVTRALRAADDDARIVIPLIEGGHDVAYLNRCLQRVSIGWEDVKQPIGVGTEVLIELRVGTSGTKVCTVTFEALDLEIVVEPRQADAVEEFWQNYDGAKGDFDLLKGLTTTTPDVASVIEQIEHRRMWQEIDENLERGVELDRTTLNAKNARVLEIRALLHTHREGINAMLLWDAHVEYCDRNMNKADEIIEEVGISDRKWLEKRAALKVEYEAARAGRDFSRLEDIAYARLPALFEENATLSHRTQAGGGERGSVHSLSSPTNLGSTVKRG